MSNADPKGYYAALGVSPTATPAEIDAAFARLEKTLDPNGNVDADSSRKRLAIDEAYWTLSEPDARKNYDALQFAPPQQTPLAPLVECSNCRKVTPEPRYLAFRYVISVVYMSFRRAFQGVYCPSCARSKGLQASAISGLIGWWGIPWGPIFTIPAVFKNAMGGIEPEGTRDDLKWRNAVAYIQRGDKAMAFALARDLRGSKKAAIAQNARELTDSLQAGGFDPNTVKYESGWKASPLITTLHFLFLFAIPIALVVAVMAGVALKTP
ncbi:MAG TPA: DnaJ domain-containing protein [Rhizomicrobium sp.]|jgi:hypothetical protein